MRRILPTRCEDDPIVDSREGLPRRLMDRFDNTLPLVLAAYNAREQPVITHRGIPPYRETNQFVARVLRRC